MEKLVVYLCSAIYILLNFMQTMLVIRAILSWLPLDYDHGVNRFLRAVTEPFLYPFRLLLEKSGIYRRFNLPIDLTFLVAFFVIWLIMPIFAL